MALLCGKLCTTVQKHRSAAVLADIHVYDGFESPRLSWMRWSRYRIEPGAVVSQEAVVRSGRRALAITVHSGDRYEAGVKEAAFGEGSKGKTDRGEGKKIEGAGTLRFLRPLSIVPQSFLCFPAQSEARVDLFNFPGKRSSAASLWKAVHDCAKEEQLKKGLGGREERAKKSRAQEPCDSCALFQLCRKVFYASRLNLRRE